MNFHTYLKFNPMRKLFLDEKEEIEEAEETEAEKEDEEEKE